MQMNGIQKMSFVRKKRGVDQCELIAKMRLRGKLTVVNTIDLKVIVDFFIFFINPVLVANSFLFYFQLQLVSYCFLSTENDSHYIFVIFILENNIYENKSERHLRERIFSW